LFLVAVVIAVPVIIFRNVDGLPALPTFAEAIIETNLVNNNDSDVEHSHENNEDTIPVWSPQTIEEEIVNAEEQDTTPTDEVGESDEIIYDTPDTLPGQEAFVVFPFYMPFNAEAYANFQTENPDMDAETVVWKVNAFLHLPFYYHIVTNYDANPLLVNPFHRLPYGFSPAILVPVYDGNPSLLSTPETAEAFRLMRLSAQSYGLDLAVVSAYRPASRQEVLFERQGRVDGVVARPYQSEHQTGRALDLWGPTGLLDSGDGPPSPTGIWVRGNAHNYGFIVRYTEENTHITGFINEPWHITYVTYPIAQYIVSNNLTSLEEFVARYPNWILPQP